MKKPDLKELTRQFDDASKALARDRHDFEIQKNKDKIEHTRLITQNKRLAAKNKLAQTELNKKIQEMEMLDGSTVNLLEVNTKLEASAKRATAELDELMRQISEANQELIDKKSNLDKELEEYATTRKQEIKAEILKANEELIVIQEKISQVNIQLEVKNKELADINQVYVNEQAELKQSNEQTERLLAENREQQASIKKDVDTRQRELQELDYKKDQILAVLAKAKEEHEKFLDYERKARKILDTKDRQLQEKAGEIAEGNQFLKNQRSYLPEM